MCVVGGFYCFIRGGGGGGCREDFVTAGCRVHSTIMPSYRTTVGTRKARRVTPPGVSQQMLPQDDSTVTFHSVVSVYTMQSAN